MRVPFLLRTGLCIALLIGPRALPASLPAAQLDATGRADTTAVTASAPADSTATEASPPYSRGTLDILFEAVVIIVLVLLAAAALVGAVIGFAAVSIFMDNGCLRIIVFCIGWHLAFWCGLAVGLVVAAPTGAEGLAALGVSLGLIGYPAGWAWGLRRVQQLPREEYMTWKRTLTTGALLGAGAGSVLNLARSAAVLFKGGGGGFGGGGASGSFASIQAGGATAVGTTAASETTPSHAPAFAEPLQEATRVRRRILGTFRLAQRLHWYHGCAFVLVVLLFVPVGLSAVSWLQDPTTFIIVAVLFAVAVLLRWLERRAEDSDADDDPNGKKSPFRGGAASDTW